MKLMLRIEYLGIPFLSITWLGMAWAYFDPKGLPKRYRLGLLLPCLATLVAFQTNDAHRLFYTSLDFVRLDDWSVAVAVKGPLYWLHIAYLNLCIAAGILLFIRAWRQSITAIAYTFIMQLILLRPLSCVGEGQGVRRGRAVFGKHGCGAGEGCSWDRQYRGEAWPE